MPKKDAEAGAAAGGERELAELMDELDALLKNPDVGALLTARGINTSIAILVSEALRAYLKGNKKEAAEDLSIAAEEIAARLANAPSRPDKLPS